MHGQGGRKIGLEVGGGGGDVGEGGGGSDGGALHTNIGKGKPTLLPVFIDRSQPARPRTIKRWLVDDTQRTLLYTQSPDLSQ